MRHHGRVTAPQHSPAQHAHAEAHVFHGGEVSLRPLDLAGLERELRDPETFVWLDLVAPTPQELESLCAPFGLHPLAIEDAAVGGQRVKVEPYNDFWFVVLYGAYLGEKGELVRREMSLFIGSHFVLTIQREPLFSDEEIVARWQLVPEAWRHRPSSLTYVILDTVVDSLGVLTDHIEGQLREVRAALASGHAVGPELLRRIFILESVTHEAYTVALSLRDMLPTFVHASEGAPVGTAGEAPYYRDVHDHASGVVERLGAERDLSKRVFDVYQSLAAQQQGDVARQLTVVSTIFLPLTFLTGFFGQNFDYLVKHVSSEWAFWGLGVGSYCLSLVAIGTLIRRVSKRAG